MGKRKRATMNTKKTATRLFAIALAMLSFSLSASDQDLFPDTGEALRPDPAQPWVLRARSLRPDLAALARVGEGDRLGLYLFANARFDGLVLRVEPLGSQRRVLHGELVGHPGSRFTLARNQGVLVGTIDAGDDGIYRIRHTASGHQVIEVDQGAYPPCGSDAEHEVINPGPDAVGTETAVGTDAGTAAAVMDVMVVYTPNARTAVGGTAAMEAMIDLAEAETNAAYTDSGIASRIRLVHRYEVDYNSSGNFNTDLNRLTAVGDGYLDDVHPIRDQYGADLVSLLIDDSDYCGIAWLMTNLSTSFATHAFSVVYHDCATGYYSFGHEIGHNQGCAHDRDNAGSALFPYSYGWRFSGQDGRQYRTVMAYSPGTRIGHFSSPLVTYQGTPTGTPTDDNARSIDEAAATVAAFRDGAATCPATAVLADRTGGEGDLDLLHAFRARVLPSLSDGERLDAAYYRFGPEVAEILLADRRLAGEARRLVTLLRPTLEAAAAGEDFALAANQRSAVAAFARDLTAAAGADLAAALDAFASRLEHGDW